MSATGSTPASVIEESLPHEGWPSSDGEEIPPGIGPYKLAWRRLRRNKVALAFGGLFLAIVILCLLAPVYANDIAHTGPEPRERRHGAQLVRVADRADLACQVLPRRGQRRP